VVVLNESSTWPVTRVGPRHVFQAGGRGGTPPEGYLARPHTPWPDDEAAESEWALDPAFRQSVLAWCDSRSYRYVEIGYIGPQAPAAAVATVMRDWYRARGEPPCPALLHPGRSMADHLCSSGPVLIHFAVQPALQALDEYLNKAGRTPTSMCCCSSTVPSRPGSPDPMTSKQ
jgi:hypothetical protein